MRSLSSRRAWIEIDEELEKNKSLAGRSPRGERGLKCDGTWFSGYSKASLSSRRAWIEISTASPTFM